MPSIKKIFFNRNKNVYESFNSLIRNIMFINTSNGLKYDRGSNFIKGMDLKDGEPILFRYKNIETSSGKISTVYGLVYRDVNGDNQDKDFGKYRHISLFKTYDEMIKVQRRILDAREIKPNIVKSLLKRNDLINMELISLSPGDNINFSVDKNDTSTLLIQGEPNTDTLYSNGEGINLNNTNHTFSVKPSGTNIFGGLRIPNGVPYDETFRACPIVNGIPYYKDVVNMGAGNDYSSRNLYVKSGGWYRIAKSTLEKLNYGIFNISANLEIDGFFNTSSISFIASFNNANTVDPNGGILNESSVNLTELNSSLFNKTYNFPIINSVRMIFPKNNDRSKECYIDIFVNNPNIKCNINIDISNLSQWVILDNLIKVEESIGGYNEYRLTNFKNKSMGAFNMQQGNFLKKTPEGLFSYRVIDEHCIASTTKGGIIKLGVSSIPDGFIRYVRLDAEKKAYIDVGNRCTYNLPYSNNTTLGGLKIGGTASTSSDYILTPLGVSNEVPNTNIPVATNNDYGIFKLGGNKDNSISDSLLKVPNSGQVYPVQLDVNNRLFVKLPSSGGSKATDSTLGTIKLGSNQEEIETPSVIDDPNSSYYGLNLTQNDQACIGIPTENRVPYTLPNANDVENDITKLGGIKLRANKINQEINASIINRGTYFPIFMDNNKVAYAGLYKGAIFENPNVSNCLTLCIDNFEIFQILCRNASLIINGISFHNYQKFIIYHRCTSIEVVYFIRSILPYLGNNPLEMDIYTGRIWNTPDGAQQDRTGHICYTQSFPTCINDNFGYDTYCNIKERVGVNQYINDALYFDATQYSAHIHINRIFPPSYQSFPRPTFTILVDFI